MESDTKAPKYTDRAGDDQDLREELNRAIDRELEKPPEKIDHAKIDSMIGLLDQMDGRGNSSLSKIFSIPRPSIRYSSPQDHGKRRNCQKIP